MTAVRIIENTFEQDTFNKMAVHPLQSWQWGEARRQMGLQVTRIGEFQKDRLINVFQLTIHPLPLISSKLGYLPRSVFPSPDVLRFLKEYAQANKLLFVKIEPYVKKESIFKTDLSLLKLSPHPLFPVWTQILDLTVPEHILLDQMKHKTRYNIRLAQKKGVVVKEMSNDEGFEIFQRLYFETCRRQKYYGHSKEYHKTVWDFMKKDIARILVAFVGSTPVAAYELFCFNNVFYYPYGGTAMEHRNTMAANLLMWEAILLGKKLGAATFDMWGSLPPVYDPQEAWSGFTRFKEGYGGQFTELIASHDLVVQPALYALYNAAYVLREQYLRIKKMV